MRGMDDDDANLMLREALGTVNGLRVGTHHTVTPSFLMVSGLGLSTSSSSSIPKGVCNTHQRSDASWHWRSDDDGILTSIPNSIQEQPKSLAWRPFPSFSDCFPLLHTQVKVEELEAELGRERRERNAAERERENALFELQAMRKRLGTFPDPTGHAQIDFR